MSTVRSGGRKSRAVEKPGGRLPVDLYAVQWHRVGGLAGDADFHDACALTAFRNRYPGRRTQATERHPGGAAGGVRRARVCFAR